MSQESKSFPLPPPLKNKFGPFLVGNQWGFQGQNLRTSFKSRPSFFGGGQTSITGGGGVWKHTPPKKTWKVKNEVFFFTRWMSFFNVPVDFFLNLLGYNGVVDILRINHRFLRSYE